MKNFKTLALIGTLSLAFAAPAMAAVSASATVSSFTITLVDLDPLDGIAPTFTWDNPYGSYAPIGSYTYANVYENSGNGPNEQMSNYGALGSSNTSTATSSHGSATASVGASSTPLTPSGLVSASGSAYAHSTNWQTSFLAGAHDPHVYFNSFSLSANTAVLFSATTMTQATTTAMGCNPVTGPDESANAKVFLSVQGMGPSGSGYQYSSDTNSASASPISAYDSDYNLYYLPETVSQAAILKASFVNASNGILNGQIDFYAQVSGSTDVAAVPEPETYAMLLAGLGLLGAVARRRQAR